MRKNKPGLTAIVILILLATPAKFSEAAAPQASVGVNAAEANKSAACPAISADTLLYRLKQKHRVILVDIRSGEEFGSVGIPGAINLPLHFVKTKPFLKSRPLVLVHGGYPSRQTEAVCRELSAGGYRVSILSGGLLAWQRSGGQLIGDLFFLQRYKHISALKFHQEKDRADQVVIDVSERLHPQAKRLFPDATHLPYPQRLTPAAVRDAAGRKKVIVMFSDSGGQYDRIEKVIAAAGLENVFYLEGGLAAYRRYLSDRILAGRARERRIKNSAACLPCGQQK